MLLFVAVFPGFSGQIDQFDPCANAGLTLRSDSLDRLPSRIISCFPGNLGHPNQKMGWLGLEPRTNALKGRCSTIELPTQEKEECNSIG